MILSVYDSPSAGPITALGAGELIVVQNWFEELKEIR
jgi:hypothetical protein